LHIPQLPTTYLNPLTKTLSSLAVKPIAQNTVYDKHMKKPVQFLDWGLIDYKEAWDKQEELFKQKVDLKLANRQLPSGEPTTYPQNDLIFCEHPHVYTLGKSGSIENLLVTGAQLKELEATYYAINRGGDITYHGPGQIVGYPIIDLEQFFTDIHLYLRTLEEAIILTLAEYDLKAERYEGYTGVWFDAEDTTKTRKICAMGVRCSRWVTMHGFAFNVNAHLDYFNNIVPCGIDDKQVTSMEKELGRKVEMEEVKHKLKNHIAQLFQMQLMA
jgi:lipoyl(octanoyl) transferase